MIEIPGVQSRDIRWHYDLGTPFYWLFWGRDIHHGLWLGDESPAEARRRLSDAVAGRAGIAPGDRVLDVGCGMGGSSIYLAQRFNAQVTGVTLSPVQCRWARTAALLKGVSRRARFLRRDVETLELPAATVDVVWSIECTEHLFDKPRFFERAATWLRPGGRMAVCAWLAGDDLDAARRRQLERVCRDNLCPSLGTFDDYVEWMRLAGLTEVSADDWTAQVSQTWEICRRRVERSRVRPLAHLLGHGLVEFVDGFGNLLDAYRSGAMRYSCFAFRKPESPS